MQALLEAAEGAAQDTPMWRLAWCAGAGVIGSSAADLDAEVECFAEFIRRMPRPPAAAFIASSAGGAYAGSPDEPPYTEASAAVAVNAYGHAKLRIEAAVSPMSAAGTRVCLGRIANIYGPGQNLRKPQGLVSQLCLTHLNRQPLGIHVSLDSLRDYVFVTDAAEVVCACLSRVAAEPAGAVVTKIVASGQSRSVGAIIGESTRAFRRRPLLTTPSSRTAQVRDLRVRSEVWPEIDRLARTPFLVGLRRTVDDIDSQLRATSLPGGR
ncbi:NAD-dependent epimerase/dehydratase family protein [Nocardioides astragali]|uniref:NAD-dependent epimerase/dehydratase family protein n=1 Tax=Nocardioides astragali TaxID=1776736 RepID=A0ABW2NA96_9ACTN|nr:NAD-dependent epimerase/dehydratase family protein [Nocardioides astragali]